MRYIGATGRTVGIQGRWAGSQFDDDRNTFPLGTMRTVDAFLALPLARVLDVFVAGENVLGGRYEVGPHPRAHAGAAAGGEIRRPAPAGPGPARPAGLNPTGFGGTNR